MGTITRLLLLRDPRFAGSLVLLEQDGCGRLQIRWSAGPARAGLLLETPDSLVRWSCSSKTTLRDSRFAGSLVLLEQDYSLRLQIRWFAGPARAGRLLETLRVVLLEQDQRTSE